MDHNLAARPKNERDKVNVELAASDVAYKERLSIPVIPMEVELQQPEEYREYFRECLRRYRQISINLPGALAYPKKNEG